MTQTFVPRLETLPPAQQRLWAELGETPDQFVLYGGTAIALRLGHRESADFDFFSRTAFDPDRLFATVPYLKGARVLQKDADTLTCRVDRGGTVQVSFFGDLGLGRIDTPDMAEPPGLAIASLLDLAGTKAAVVQKRAAAKDYFDIDALIARGGLTLPMALAAGRAIYGIGFEPQITLKALSYFGDGDLPTLAEDVRRRLVDAVRSVDLERLPALTAERGAP
jgi:hypothetical protein